MLKFIDEKGIEHLVQAEIKASNGVNGERSISGEIHSNDIVIHAIGRGWKLEFENEFYCITYAYPDDDGKDVIVEFDAVHQFFYDFEKSVVYKELNGSNTFDAYLHFIFDGTDYLYRVETEVAAFEKQNFGMRNRLSLFNDIINSVGVEYVVSGKVVRVVERVGTDLSTIVRKGFNLQDLKLEHNIGNFITYKKGYGAFIDPDDETKGRLEVEYRSPLADVYGELEGDPIIDERYTIEGNLFERLKNEVDNSYSISVSLNMEDLTEAGYEQERPHAGDYIMAINEDVGFEEKVRIVSFTSSFDVDGGLIGHQVTCNSISMANRQSKGDKAWKSQVEANLEHAVTSAEYAAISADGKNMTFTGLFGPDGKGEPKATKTGDTWYKPIGEETDVYRWDGQAWVFLMSTKDNKIIQEKIEEVEGEVEKSKQASEEALSEAEISREEARQAKQQAFNSEQLANSAKQDAILAIQKGDQNSTQITTLEGQQKLTNTKVEGNTANILNLQTDSEKLSLSIGKVQADVENIADGGYNYQLQGNNMYHNKWIIHNQTVGDISAIRAVIDGFNVVTLRKHVANSGWSFFGIEKSMLVRPMDLANNREWGLTMHIHSNKETPFRGYVQDAGSVNRSIQFEAITLQPGWQTVTMKSEIVNIESNETNNMLWFSASSWPKDTEISVAWYVQRPNTTTLKQWVPALSETIDYSKFATLEANVNGFQTTVNNEITGLKTQQTQMAGQITSTVESVNNIDSATTNLILDSFNRRVDPRGFNGGWSRTDNITVDEWKTDKAKNFKGYGSIERIFGTITSGKATPNNTTRKGFNYVWSIYIRNNHQKNNLQLSNNAGTTQIIKPKEVLRVVMKGLGNGGSFLQLNFVTQTAGEEVDFDYFQPMIAEGNVVSAWSPAPEDNASKSEVIQLSDQITQTVNKVETVDGKVTSQQSQITQLSDNINLKVDKDNVIAQINLSHEQVLIQAKRIHLSGESLIDDAIITNAMIKDVSADKMTVGTLNASNVNIINLNAANLSTGYINADRIKSNSITADKVHIEELSALSSNLGEVYAGKLYSPDIQGASILSSVFKVPNMESIVETEYDKDIHVTQMKFTRRGLFLLTYVYEKKIIGAGYHIFKVELTVIRSQESYKDVWIGQQEVPTLNSSIYTGKTTRYPFNGAQYYTYTGGPKEWLYAQDINRN